MQFVGKRRWGLGGFFDTCLATSAIETSVGICLAASAVEALVGIWQVFGNKQ